MAASLVLHALVVVLAMPEQAEARRDLSPDTVPDVWAGNTVDIDATGGVVSPAVPPPEPAPAEPAEAQAEAGEHPARAPKPPQAALPREPAQDAPAEPVVRRPPAAERPHRPVRPAQQPVPEWQRMFAARAEQLPSSGSGTFGAEATGAPVRNLAKAFTRAITQATNADRIWAKLPLGDAGSVTVRIIVDEQQNVASAEPLDEVVPAHLERLIEGTLRFLKVGRFSLSAAGVGAGSETFKLELSIAEESADTDFQLGFDPPRIGRPGKAYFRNWGRRFEARVTIVSSEARR